MQRIVPSRTPTPEAASRLDISVARIEAATRLIDPVFLNTPQYVDETLCRALGRQILVKVETANPLRCFKGRGTDMLMSRFRPGQRVVCASTGDFGAAIAYAGRRHGVTVDVFAPERSEERRVGKECRSRWSPYH